MIEHKTLKLLRESLHPADALCGNVSVLSPTTSLHVSTGMSTVCDAAETADRCMMLVSRPSIPVSAGNTERPKSPALVHTLL